MVFSLFKKRDKGQKMPEREIVLPKPAFVPASQKPAASETAAEAGDEARIAAEPLPDLEFTPSAPKAPPKSAAETLSDFEREFTESSVMAIDVDHGTDSLQSDIERVAVLYANGQDPVVRPLIEQLLPAYPGAEGVRLWNMLLDFLMLAGDRATFDKLCVDFTQACEMSPPAWRESVAKPAPAPAAAVTVAEYALQGVLAAGDQAALTPLSEAVRARRPLRVDCGGLVGCDDEMAGSLGEVLLSARRQGVPIVLEQVESLIRRLRGRLATGEAQNARSWILLLELLQRHGTQAEFEECAIDFAVTFERSPPSWETTPQPALPAAAVKPVDGAHYLSGEIKSHRFEDLAGYFALSEHVILDFSGVRRLDFFSAGQLVNRLAPLKECGRDIVIRSPNHLVAELMAVVGINKLARIIVPKS